MKSSGLKTLYDHLNWDKIIDYIRYESEIPTDEKEEIIEAYVYLKNNLGKKFLVRTYEDRLELGRTFYNKAPWVLKWGVWMMHTLRRLEAKGYDQFVLNKLKSRDRADEGMAFMELSSLFSKVGFDFIFEPEIRVGYKRKFPDIKLTNNNTYDEIYVELTELDRHTSHKTSASNQFEILELLQKSRLQYSGRVKYLDESELKEVIALLKGAIADVSVGGVFKKLSMPLLTMGLATEDKLGELSTWASQHNLHLKQLVCDYPDFGIEINRIISTIKWKSDQLILGSNNIVAIHLHYVILIGIDIPKLLIAVATELRNHPNLWGVLIYGNISLNPNDVYCVFDNHLLSIGSFNQPNRRTFLLVRNNFQESSLSQDSIDKIYEALRF